MRGRCRVDASGLISVEKAESVIERTEQVEVEEPILEASEAAAGNDTASDDPTVLLTPCMPWHILCAQCMLNRIWFASHSDACVLPDIIL